MKHFFQQGLLPAVTLNDAEAAKRLAEIYLKAGLDVLEITLRTDATLAAIEGIAKNFPELHIGIGTILRPTQIQSAKDAGAQFGLSPGFNEKVVQKAGEANFPFIPGVMTPTEIETALACDCTILKLFPAKHLDAVDYIKSMEGPYAQTGVKFIPMGGVSMENMADYLACPSVIAVGGSWLAPKDLIQAGRFNEIEEVVLRSLEIAR